MAWPCTAANGTGSLVFFDDMSAERSSRMDSEVYGAIPLALIQPDGAKLIGRCFAAEINNDPKHTVKANQELLKAKKRNILQWPSQSLDLNPTEHSFNLMKTKLRAERPSNKQQMKAVAVKGWQSISREETQHLKIFHRFVLV